MGNVLLILVFKVSPKLRHGIFLRLTKFWKWLCSLCSFLESRQKKMIVVVIMKLVKLKTVPCTLCVCMCEFVHVCTGPRKVKSRKKDFRQTKYVKTRIKTNNGYS